MRRLPNARTLLFYPSLLFIINLIDFQFESEEETVPRATKSMTPDHACVWPAAAVEHI